MLGLRDYQLDALEAVGKAEARGVQRPLVVHPTGAGKTVVFSHMMAARPGRSLVLVHRDELIGQTIAKLAMIAPEISVGVVKAERNETAADVVVASVQTAYRDNRLAELAGFSTVVVDEAHHASAPSWRKVLTHLGSFTPGGPLTVGFTATPQRDAGSLGVWEEVVAYRSIREMIYEDYLVMPTAQAVDTSADFSEVRTTAGDFSEGALGAELERSGAIDEMAYAYVQYAVGRKSVAFLPTVDTAKQLSLALQLRGVKAEAIWGDQPQEQRRAVLRRLHSGETTCVTNCAVLTEGFDESSVDCIVVARPTKSHPLYIQMIGRGLRKHPGKNDCLILDLVGATGRHDLVALVDLGLDKRAKPKPVTGKNCPVCNVPFTEQELAGQLTQHIQCFWCELCGRGMGQHRGLMGETRHENCQGGQTGKRDPFATSKMRWLPVDTGFCLGTDKGVVVMSPTGGPEDLWALINYQGTKLEVLHAALPVEWAQGIGEDRAKAFGKLSRKNAGWLRLQPTHAQFSRLVREGLPAEKLGLIKTRGEAADLLTRLQGRRALRKLARS